jgi:hypothetical protein
MKWTIVITALLTLAACQGKDASLDPTLEGFFPEDVGEVRKPNQFADASAAAGARADAMLFKQHFDGPRLNSLGEEKLSLMLKDDDAPGPMTVYLKLSDTDAAAKARESAVITFLKDKGLKDDQIEVVMGDNPAARSPAAAHMSRAFKTEIGEGGATSASSASPKEASSGQGSAAGGTDGSASAK